MAAVLMVSVFPTYGVFGKGLKPVPFLVTLVPVLFVVVVATSYCARLAWYEGIGLFYVGLALAELGYLGAVCLWSGDGIRQGEDRAQDRSAA